MTRKPIDTEPLEQWEYLLIIEKLKDHWRLFYKLLSETGVRVSEALAINKKKDLENMGVWVTRGKREDHPRDHIPLSVTLFTELQTHALKVAGQRLFPYTRFGAWLALKEACKVAGVRPSIHPHSFRHGFGHRAVHANLGCGSALEQLILISRLLGHKGIRYTERYTKATKTETEAAFRKLNT